MAILGRSKPIKPHLAAPVVAGATFIPVIAGATVKAKLAVRSFERRGVPHPHLSGPVVAPGGPVVPGETVHLVGAVRRPQRDWEAKRQRPHLAKPLLFVPGPPLQVGTFIERIVDFRSVERRGAPKPHTVTNLFTAPTGGNPMPSLVRTGLFPRGQWRVPQIHLPAALITFGTPVIPGSTVTLWDKQRPFVGRTVPRPHLPANLIVFTNPVIAPATILLVVTDKRTTQGRGGHFRVAPVNLTQPAPTSPFPPAIVKGQSMKRPHIGRTVPRAHLARPNLQAQPFPPAVVKSQCLRRPYVGRTTPRPHEAPPIVTQPAAFVAPVGPGLFLYQAKQSELVARLVHQFMVAPPITMRPTPTLNIITLTGQIAAPRWSAYVGKETRWHGKTAPARWTATSAQARWKGKVTRNA